jgi:hypothetical protein
MICSANRVGSRDGQTVERVKGIEPSSSAWKAVALPLSYTRETRAQAEKWWCGQSAPNSSPPLSLRTRLFNTEFARNNPSGVLATAKEARFSNGLHGNSGCIQTGKQVHRTAKPNSANRDCRAVVSEGLLSLVAASG